MTIEENQLDVENKKKAQSSLDCLDANREFGGRTLTKDQSVFQHNAWDNVQWDEEQQKMAEKRVDEQRRGQMKPSEAEEFDAKAPIYWDDFYQKHEDKFFKDRNWLALEFPEIFASKEGTQEFRIWEVGCGAGNTIIPLIENQINNVKLFASDFSATAVQLLKNHPLYDAKICTAFVDDLTNAELPDEITPGTIDCITLIFVLSAIHPSKLPHVLARLRRALKPGGYLLIRDYGLHDLTQLRFSPARMLGDNFYVRGDGTQVYFFSPGEMSRLAEEQNMTVKQDGFDRRLIVNRLKKLKMYRVWLQAKLQRPIDS